jgi:hypothetical protein
MSVMIVMIMPVRLMRGFFGVSTALWLKRAFDQSNLAAKLARHFFDDFIAANAYAIGQDLYGQMTIAQMPRHTCKITRFCNADFGERFGCGDDFHQAPIFEHQRVAMAQHNGFREIEEKFQTLHALHRHTTAMALVKIQHNSVCRCSLPCATGADEISSHHLRPLQLSISTRAGVMASMRGISAAHCAMTRSKSCAWGLCKWARLSAWLFQRSISTK